ncbi:MAG: hypothetical protein JO056_10975 [Alphaproteobacteria bacterium]|nr:hypothetical protein [Alphaproteobacteria bacterium]
MVSVLSAAMEWLPVGFDWAIGPIALLLTGLALSDRTRPLAATGFLVAAAFSAALLSLILAASVFHLLGYGRAVVDLLLNFGLTVTRDYVITLFQENAPGLLALAPMILTTLLASIAAMYLRRITEPAA